MAPEGCNLRRFRSPEKTNFTGDIDGLGPARHTELAHDITDVELDRRLRMYSRCPIVTLLNPRARNPRISRSRGVIC